MICPSFPVTSGLNLSLLKLGDGSQQPYILDFFFFFAALSHVCCSSDIYIYIFKIAFRLGNIIEVKKVHTDI